MNTLDRIEENRMLGVWAGALSRSPAQRNRHQESDAELVELPDGENLLAVTVDTVAEEIAVGLYRDPETVGWMGAAVSLSDLAAVGARPLGMVVSVCLPADGPAGFQEGLARGLEQACRTAGTFVLGGDTNVGERASITSCALGLVPRDRVMTRTGCRPGDRIYATGPLGAGSALAARALLDLGPELYDEGEFRPIARLREAPGLAGLASACMDTSDGLLATLDQLMRLNQVGFEIATPPADLLERRSRAMAAALGVDPLLFLAGHHGEFELVFCVPAARQAELEAWAREERAAPVELGVVIEQVCVRLAGDPPRSIDTGRIRNLFARTGSDPQRYLAELTALIGGRSA